MALEPDVVRDAARIGAALATATVPELADVVAGTLRRRPPARPSTLREASQFTNRILDAARTATARAG
jgi:hypothetical protein